MSADGVRVFFDTPDPLVPQDINGKRDVYEWEEQGVGSCPVGHTGGCVYLVSSGAGPSESFFVDNSESGSDVFFATADELVPGDTDHGYDIYDARVGGGFPQPPVAAGCFGDACQGPLGAAMLSTAPGGSATLTGSADIATPAPRPLTRAQKLSAALRACHARRSKKKRAICEAQALKRYRQILRAKKTVAVKR